MLHIIQNDPEVPPGSIADHLTIPYLSIIRTVTACSRSWRIFQR